MGFDIDRLMHRAEAPFDAWRLHAAGTQREISAALAGFALQHHLLSASSDDDIDVAALRAVYARHCPALAQRADGIAACFAANAVQRPSHALTTTDDGVAFACSAAVATGAKDPLFVRNFEYTLQSLPDLMGSGGPDARPMADPVILMILEPEGGRSSIAMCSMDLLLGAIDGVNDAGFCATLLSLADGPAPTAPRSDAFDELSVVRVLLENCATVEAAIACFRDLPLYTVFPPCHYIVADRTGDRAVLEWNGREACVVRGDRAEALVCTNHSLSGGTSSETRPPEGAHSRKRYRLLSDMLRRVTIVPDMLHQAAETVRLDSFQDGGAIYGGTLWTSLYHLASPRLEVRVLSGFGQGRPIYGKSVLKYLTKSTHRS